MNETIEHKAIVREISGDKVILQVKVDTPACKTCKVKNSCAVAKMNNKFIEVKNDQSMELKPNEEIEIYYDEQLGLKAVFIGYILPFIVLILVLAICILEGLSEGLSGLIALGAMVLYYFSLYFFKKRLNRVFSFKIKSKF